MKQIVVVSDTHSQNYLLEDIKDKYPNAYLYLHCGDSEEFEANLYPFLTVKGNNDYYIENDHLLLNIDDYSLYVTHGHKLYLGKDNVVALCNKNNCNVFIHGHTHVPYYEYYKGVHIFCPGAIAYPRSAKGSTYGLITINDDKSIKFEIISF